MAKAKKVDLTNLTLPEVIKRKLNKEIDFNELLPFEKGDIISYIHNNKIDLKIFNNIGFDIIKNYFFTVEYVYSEENIWDFETVTRKFDDFVSFYEYVNGNIYDNACYYGYTFSNEEIKKYNLDIKFINFDSFIDYDILQKSFDALSKEKREKNQENIENGERIRKTDKFTILPSLKEYSSYIVKKRFDGENFCVIQAWLDKNNNIILSHKECFSYFFDFAHYLNNDISNADLIMCEGIENIGKINNLVLNDIKVRSEVAKKLNINLNLIPDDKYEVVEFEQTKNSEFATLNELLIQRSKDEDCSESVSYVTDIHMLHRFVAWKCETYEDMHYVTNVITKKIREDNSCIKLIGGDVASDFNVYNAFVESLADKRKNGKYFFTLGNHELWPFKEMDVDSIVNKYRELLNVYGICLVHNNLFYFDNGWKEIKTKELEKIPDKKLRKLMRGANIIIFGGIGFAGKNKDFNADSGIYRKTLNREEEIEQSEYFERLYLKVSRVLFDKNVIVITHMPIKDWTTANITKGFVYVSGHSHSNYYEDDGISRIYSDNQIGYKQKEVYMKHLFMSMDYNWFSDYKDGIYEITRADYECFYRGIGERITFNRQFEKLFMLKREGTYMFIMTTPKGTMQILNGGAIKNAGGHTLEYFYENLVPYSKSIKMFLSQFDEFQKNVSMEIKSIGGDGRIHGSIVDIDFYSHLYLDPLDGSITPYFAYSMVDKYVYKNVQSLLKYECPKIYTNYEKKLLNENSNNSLIVAKTNSPVIKSKIYVDSTEMYKVSRILKGLQFTTKYSIVRLWNDTIAGESSVENGRLIVRGIINPEGMDITHSEQKLLE